MTALFIIEAVVIEEKPHPPVAQIGPAVRAPYHASKDAVVGIISAPSSEALLVGYRPHLRDELGGVYSWIPGVNPGHDIARPPSISLGMHSVGKLSHSLAFPWPGPRSAPGGFSLSGTLRQLMSARP